MRNIVEIEILGAEGVGSVNEENTRISEEFHGDVFCSSERMVDVIWD